MFSELEYSEVNILYRPYSFKYLDLVSNDQRMPTLLCPNPHYSFPIPLINLQYFYKSVTDTVTNELRHF